MNRYEHTLIVDKQEEELLTLINITEIALKWMLALLLLIGTPFIISLLIQFFSLK
ncbi:MAG: hypothetical protein ACI35O_14920 [Bacillaceae bacterium]